jgi:hypothetical protein
VRRDRQARHPAVGVAAVRVAQERREVVGPEAVGEARERVPVEVGLGGPVEVRHEVAGGAAEPDEVLAPGPVVARGGRLRPGRVAGRARQVLGEQPALDEPRAVGGKERRHPRPRAQLRRVRQPGQQPAGTQPPAQVGQRRPRRRVGDRGQRPRMAAGAAEPADQLAAHGRLLLLGRLVRQLGGDVLEQPRRQRFAAEARRLPADLQPGRHARQRPVAHDQPVESRRPLERRLRGHPGADRGPFTLEHRDAVDLQRHRAADEGVEGNGGPLLEEQGAGPGRLERTGRQARVRAGIAEKKCRLRVDAGQHRGGIGQGMIDGDEPRTQLVRLRVEWPGPVCRRDGPAAQQQAQDEHGGKSLVQHGGVRSRGGEPSRGSTRLSKRMGVY